jgi:hypothetical protein
MSNIETETPKKEYTDEYIASLIYIYNEMRIEYQGLTPKQLEDGLKNIDPQWLEEIINNK